MDVKKCSLCWVNNRRVVSPGKLRRPSAGFVKFPPTLSHLSHTRRQFDPSTRVKVREINILSLTLLSE